MRVTAGLRMKVIVANPVAGSSSRVPGMVSGNIFSRVSRVGTNDKHRRPPHDPRSHTAMKTSDDNRAPEPFLERPGFMFVLLATVIGLAAFYYTIVHYAFDGFEKRGQFGDAFGAINAVFTGLAFAVVIYGIILQRRELKLQQRELAETREVFKQQSFETSYFNLQRVLAETIEGIEWDARVSHTVAEYTTVNGRRALKEIVESIYQEYCTKLQHHERTFAHQRQSCELTPATQVDWLLEVYKRFYCSNESLLGNYFRLVYNILKYVSQSDFSAVEKERYAHFFRAQLSEAELTLLVLNAMTPTGDKMRRYLQEFAMLKHATMEGRGVPRPREHFHENSFKDLDERKSTTRPPS